MEENVFPTCVTIRLCKIQINKTIDLPGGGDARL